ncbi:MAG: hypothetical protein ACTHQQ_23095, partial [Solirubrobacteraceae bacterium]
RGTVVAVDFAHWGGPIARGCGIDPASGYALLHAAGFTTAGDAHDGAAFICRIGNQTFDDGTLHPTSSQASCNGTPGTSAYWSYWVAPAGQKTWTYSPLGPMGDVPKPGEVELWMFGATNVGGTRGSGVPKFAPSALRAANTPATKRAPKPSKAAATTATHAASAPASSKRTGHRSAARRRTATRRRRPARSTRKRTAAPRPSHRAAPARAAPVAPARRTTPTVVAAQPTAEHTSSGSAGPLVVGLCLALTLAAGTLWTVRRRRRYE